MLHDLPEQQQELKTQNGQARRENKVANQLAASIDVPILAPLPWGSKTNRRIPTSVPYTPVANPDHTTLHKADV
jgi:hypothetical protein